MTKNEILVVGGILLVIGVAASFNFRSALVKARDVQRKNDLKHIGAALNYYFDDYGAYPESFDGQIAACGDPLSPSPCQWGVDGISDYINPLPIDPLSSRGYQYIYLTNTRNFQLYAALEREVDSEYNLSVVTRQLVCGEKICNFGVGSRDNVKLDQELPEATESATPVP